jgi:hypothetical protein
VAIKEEPDSSPTKPSTSSMTTVQDEPLPKADGDISPPTTTGILTADPAVAKDPSQPVTVRLPQKPKGLAHMFPEEVNEWIRNEHRRRHCDDTGRIVKPVNFLYLQPELDALSLETRELISKALTRYVVEINLLCNNPLTHIRLDNELANLPVSEQDATNLTTWARIECDKHDWNASERERTRLQENIVSALIERRPDVHQRHMRSFVQR